MSLLQTKLVNRTDIANYLQISKSVNEDKLNEMILKVQINEILPLLGEELFNDLMQNPTSTNNLQLMNGGTYTIDTINYINYGLKAVIVHYVDAYYKMFGDATDTPFGLVQKLNGNESKPIERIDKKTMFTENRNVAYNLWLNVEQYLIKTKNELFFKNKTCFNKNNNTFNIQKITRI